ncbi:hypothetical protein VTK56DRAFT_169 [Thermocarpiscus australiensis]
MGCSTGTGKSWRPAFPMEQRPWDPSFSSRSPRYIVTLIQPRCCPSTTHVRYLQLNPRKSSSTPVIRLFLFFSLCLERLGDQKHDTAKPCIIITHCTT